MSSPGDQDRLKKLEKLLDNNDRRGSRLCWIRWAPNSKYGYEIDDAREEVRWMIYEIVKLRQENSELKAFVDRYREDMEKELGKS